MPVISLNQSYSHYSLPEGAKARIGTEYLTGNIVFSPDGMQLVVPCSTGIWLYDASTFEVIDLITENRIYNSSEIEYKRQCWKQLEINNSVGFNSDGEMFSIKVHQTSEQYTLLLWEESAEQPRSIPLECPISLECPMEIDFMVSCPNGKILAGVSNPDDRTSSSGFKNSNIYLWDIDTGELLNSLTVNGSKRDSLIFSPDGKTLAGGCEDGTVLLWNVEIKKKNVVLREEIEPNQDRSLEIKRFCKERGIETLFHFTRIEYLHNILQDGLLGRRYLEKHGLPFIPNDPVRADWCPEANCLSISFPNYPMFYSIRKKKKSEGVNDSQWVVLLLDAKVLWELDCAFCQRNAASNAISTISLDKRKKPETLKDMFSDFYGIKHQNLSIPQNYPTHPQAEVLVFDQIPMEYINAIHFRDATIMKQWRSNYTGTFSDKFFNNQECFFPRSDYEFWKPEKFNDDGIPLSYFSDGNDEEPDNFDDDIPF